MLASSFRKVLNATYVNNTGGSHELFTKNILLSGGFTEVSNKQIQFNSEEFWKNHYLKNWDKASNIPNKTVIIQPFGSQKTPDKIIKYKNILIPWEDKSSKDIKPTYNGGLPKLECFYIFTSEKHDKTTINNMFDITSNEVLGFVRVTRTDNAILTGNLKQTFIATGGNWNVNGSPSTISYNNSLQLKYGAKVIDINTTGIYLDFTAILDDLTLFIGLKN